MLRTRPNNGKSQTIHTKEGAGWLGTCTIPTASDKRNKRKASDLFRLEKREKVIYLRALIIQIGVIFLKKISGKVFLQKCLPLATPGLFGGEIFSRDFI